MTGENNIAYPRVFNPGDPGIPDEGIIVGRGGGFTQVYDDLVILPNGLVRFMTYITEEATIPEDYESVRLLIDYPETFEQFLAELERINFRSINIKPPVSTAWEYVVLIEKDKGSHAVIWALNGDAPDELLSAAHFIRKRIAEKFTAMHGK
jgi:hypothetical protein